MCYVMVDFLFQTVQESYFEVKAFKKSLLILSFLVGVHVIAFNFSILNSLLMIFNFYLILLYSSLF